MIDSQIFRDQYGTEPMRLVFSDRTLVQKWAECEAALAQAESEVGLVPAPVAEEIAEAQHRLTELDLQEMRDLVGSTGHPLMPFLICFREILSEEAGRYMHWGATSQDIVDTAVVLQTRDAIELITGQVASFTSILLDLANEHDTTPMAGRTHGQHAIPITYGLKIVGLAAEMSRHAERLMQLERRLLVGQLGGAAGSMAALGEYGLEVRRLYCEKLGVDEPTTVWHSARDSFAEYVFLLSMITMTVGRAATEVIELQRTEIGEVAEPTSDGRIGSSTMPQKENPMLSEVVVALARMQKSQPVRVLDAMVQVHERDMTTWNAEWAAIAEASITASAALDQIAAIYGGLEINEARMLSNLGFTQGRINAEAAVFLLAPVLGRPEAYELVKRASRESQLSHTHFNDALWREETVQSAVSRQQLEEAVGIARSTAHTAEVVRDAIRRLTDPEVSTPDRPTHSPDSPPDCESVDPMIQVGRGA